jgi:hypothetical protein
VGAAARKRIGGSRECNQFFLGACELCQHLRGQIGDRGPGEVQGTGEVLEWFSSAGKGAGKGEDGGASKGEGEVGVDVEDTFEDTFESDGLFEGVFEVAGEVAVDVEGVFEVAGKGAGEVGVDVEDTFEGVFEVEVPLFRCYGIPVPGDVDVDDRVEGGERREGQSAVNRPGCRVLLVAASM